MLIQVHLLLFGQIVRLVVLTTLNPKEHKHMRHALKNAPPNHPSHHRMNKIRTRNVIPFVQGSYGLPDFPIVPSKQELIYPKRYLSKPEGQVYFIPPDLGLESEARNIGKGELMWAKDDDIEGRELDMRDDMPRKYFEGPREQRKLPVGDEIKVDTSQQPSPLIPKSDFNLIDNIIAKMTPEAQNALVEIILKHLENKSKQNSAKPNVVHAKPAPQLQGKPNSAQDKTASPKLLMSVLEEKHDVNSPTQLIQPFSLSVDKTKLQALYKILNDEKMKSHDLKASTVSQNADINEILGAEIRKSNECTKCIHYVISTQTPKSTTVKNHEHATESAFACKHDHLAKVDNEPVDFHSKVVNLTQIFNVHPRLLVVNSNLPTGEKISGSSKRCSRPPVGKKGKESEPRKPCLKTLGPVYYVDVDDFAANLGE